MALPGIDLPTYHEDIHVFMELGYELGREDSVGALHVWRGPQGTLYCAFDHKDMQWVFRFTRASKPSPVFDSLPALLAWLKVEGWIA